MLLTKVVINVSKQLFSGYKQNQVKTRTYRLYIYCTHPSGSCGIIGLGGTETMTSAISVSIAMCSIAGLW